ncbi:hypothetical protein NX02_22110 [Sphingomonas sanxanigenens DSM 19645 = NX02]|uniref:Phosphoadenosine phosphosulphate reductase domain-containing protein n=2 Tax=Sphingomonas sanxanigenens TaxID=397260 RepID=W0AIF3_9SPHN|nr:hypothetical protein NX02_22110 [Sphingomonas sanxanigenens DSM 19645 = NX02]
MFAPRRALDAVAVDDTVNAAIAQGAWFAFSLSGGKDSAALSLAAMRHLDAAGHPRERRIAIHADLGRAEWQSTPGVVERTAAALGLPLTIVRRAAGDLVDRWEVRFRNGKARYEDLSTYNLIGPWSQANKRFCTSELKAQVIGPHLSRTLRGETIVQVVGIRREESTGRKATPISKADNRYAELGNRHGTRMMLWHPGVEWSAEEIFSCHARHGLELHEAYTAHGSSRLSCAFCVLASIGDLRAAASAVGNRALYLHLVEMEANSTFSFQPDRWLGDVAPDLLPPSLASDLARGKRDAERRRSIEEGMPAGLRYVKGWPQRMPTMDEAKLIAGARRSILLRHNLDDRFPTGRHVIERFGQLMAEKERRLAA